MRQRRICRLLFFTLCVAPTLAVAGWAAARSMPGAARGPIDWLGGRLGLQIECESVETPRPGVTRLAGAVLRDPETSARVASIDRIEAFAAGGEVLLHLGTVTLPAEKLPAAQGVADRLLQGDWPPGCRLRADKIRLESGSRLVAEWRGVRGRLAPLAAGQSTGRQIELASAGAAPCRLVLTRNRLIDPPATRLSLDTGDQALPWSLLAPATPIRGGADTAATFRGSLAIERGPQGRGELRASLAGLPAEELFAENPPAIETEAPLDITIDRLLWRGGRVEELTARVIGGPGRATRQAVFAANTILRCEATAPFVQQYNATTGDWVPFDQLALGLKIDSSGLTLTGDCRDAAGRPLGCLVSRSGAPMLLQPATGRLPLVALLRFVAPPGAEQRPATPLAEAIARRLPRSLPQVDPRR